MDMIGKIRRMHGRDKNTKREIARATGLSRNTAVKWLKEAQPVVRVHGVVLAMTGHGSGNPIKVLQASLASH